jgi:hypothetical protein
MLLGLPYMAVDVLGSHCYYQTDSWGERYAYIAYECPELNVDRLSVRFTILKEGERAEDIFGELPPELNAEIEVTSRYDEIGTYSVIAGLMDSRYTYFSVLETDKYVYSVQIYFPEDATKTLEEFYISDVEEILHAVIQVSLKKSRAVPLPTPTPLSPQLQTSFDKLNGTLISEEEAMQFYDGRWESLEDYVASDYMCRRFEDRTNDDVLWVSFSNCIIDQDSDVVDQLFPTGAVPLESSHAYDTEFVLWGGKASNGHSIFAGWIVEGDFIYRVRLESRTISATPEGRPVEDVFDQTIDDFIYNVLMTNHEKGRN